MCQWYILEASVLATWPLIISRDKPVLWKCAKNNLSSSEASYWKASSWWSFCNVNTLVSWGLDTAPSVNNLTVFFPLSNTIEEQILYDGLTCDENMLSTKLLKVVQHIWISKSQGEKMYICTEVLKCYHKTFAFLLHSSLSIHLLLKEEHYSFFLYT